MKILINGFFLSILIVTLYGQRPGDIYPLFGDEGSFLENWEDTSSIVYSVQVLPNGNIVAGGNNKVNDIDSSKIFVISLDEQGNLLDFGNFPRGFRYWFDSHNFTNSVSVLPDNKILLAGRFSIEHVGSHPYVIRLLENGQLDEEFGINGIYANSSVEMNVSSMKVIGSDDSYNIVLCGSSVHPMLMMIDDEGSLVSGFGTDGIVLVTDDEGRFYDMAVDEESHYLYACGRISGGTAGPILARFDLPDGELSTGFGTGGILQYTTGPEAGCYFNAMVYDGTDNTIALFGDYVDEAWDSDIFAHRVHASDGSTDMSFGVNGWSTVQSNESSDYIASALLQSDGKYYFAGSSTFSGTYDFLLGRINHNGFGDTTFGTNGLVLTDFGYWDEIESIALSPAENILYAAGYAEYPDSNSLRITAYFTGYSTSSTSIMTDERINKVISYPNPSAGIVTVETGITGLHRVQVFDLAGQEMYNTTFAGDKINIDLGSLQPSVYIVHVTLPDQQVITCKIVRN